MQATNGVGASVVIIAAASKVAQENALELVSCRGHINFFGGLPQDDCFINLDSNIIHYKELFIHGSSGCTAIHLKKCIDLISKKKVNAKKFISKVVSLDELPNTMLNEENRKFLKIVVKP
jgi:L-iditol 2-dehydrogenase